MRPSGEVTASLRWRNLRTGALVSPYGSVPWASPASKPEWKLECVGWTIAWHDGTFGAGRPPWPTKAAAQAWLDAHPRFSGMGAL
jgi:hypothetical protein